jgi:uncharacterized protein YjbI with pentapeptide repeats
MDQHNQNIPPIKSDGLAQESMSQPVRLLALLGTSVFLLLLLLWLIPAVWVRPSEGESSQALAAAYDTVVRAREKTDTARAMTSNVTLVLERLKSTASAASPSPPAANATSAPPSNDAVQEAAARLASAKDEQARAETAQADAERALSQIRERQKLDAGRLTAENGSRRIAIPLVGGLFLVTAAFTYRAVGAMEKGLRAAQAAARIAQEELRAKQAKLEQDEKAATKTLEMAAETLRAAHERMQTERFARATESLDRDKPLSVRLGAIYSLERLLKDMTSVEDRGAALKVLTAYLREHRGAPAGGDLPLDSSEAEQGTDIQAVAAVLRQWRHREDDPAVDLRGAWLPYIWLGGADLSGAFLDRTDLRRANLIKVCLRGAKLIGAELSGAYLSGADLRGADLSEATLSEADLTGANLSGAYLSRADLAGANLSGADLSDADLSEADLTGTNLSGAILKGADLRKAFLTQVDLNGAHLIGAKLYDTDLSGANLSGAHLAEADLGGADLRFAVNLTQDQLDEAVTNTRTQVTPPLTVPGAAPSPTSPDSPRLPHGVTRTPPLPSLKRSPRRRVVLGRRRVVRPDPPERRAPAEHDERRKREGETDEEGHL